MLPPPSPPQGQPSSEAQPLQVAGRVGFGVGVYVAPGLVGSGATAAAGALGGLQTLGGAVGIRWWVKERLVVLPSLGLSISHTSIPSSTDAFGNFIQGDSLTNGLLAPAVSLGYAAYRGKTTRFLLIGGVGFTYQAQGQLQDIPSTGNSRTARYVTAKSLSFNVPFGFALEQFFTPRISAVVGAQAPLFEYRSTKLGFTEATTSVGANFNATQLNASIFFYTD